jgi:hypothetical protein
MTKKGAVKTKTHKRAEQNLKRRRYRPREGRSWARTWNNEPAAQMDIERRVTMPSHTELETRYDEKGPWENLSSLQPVKPHTHLPKFKD